jgi:hypothetical protein
LSIEKSLERKNIGFSNREKFSQENIWVSSKDTSLAKKKYKIFQEKNFTQKKDISFAKKFFNKK